MTDKVKFGELGYITYKRTYSRPLKDGKKEEFHDTIDRVITALPTQLKLELTGEEQSELRQYFYDMKCSVAGRFLWQLGTKTVNNLGILSLQNCAATVVDSPIRPFAWCMDALMLGCGVGYNIQREYVYELPKARRAKITRRDTADADFIVPDSREGWVRLLEKTLEAHFLTGKGFSFSTVCIRGAGVPIKSFGGTASGPEPLSQGISKISDLLNRRAGKKVRPIDCLDIMNIVGSIVVAGNVRRSAQIALGDADDLQYLNAKRWDLGSIPNHRSMSNNSVICNDINVLPDQFWNGYAGKGEPYGLINLALSRKCGRAGDTQYPDPDVIGFNPCAEQPLANYETCCLSEIFLPNINSAEELSKVISYLYKINKHSLRLKCHHPETQAIVNKNMRMGIGISGYLQATEEQKGWLSGCYLKLRELDKAYSEKMGWPTSIKLTTVKPSGTLSLLAGVTPGVHPGYAQWFIRRIRVSSSSELIPVLKEHGYPIEPQKNFDGSDDHTTSVVSFPCTFPPGTVIAEDCPALMQLEYVKRMQTEWSDNAVSCTVYYKPDELQGIKDWLKANYNDHVKSVSFLLHQDHGFAQAPYQKITREQYEELKGKVRPLTKLSVNIAEEDISGVEACESGACPIK